MRKSRIISMAAAAAAAMAFSAQLSNAANSYTWSATAGGASPYDWNNPVNWGGSGFPIGAVGAGDTANLSVALTGNLLVDLPLASSPYYIASLTLGAGASPFSTDIGDNNLDGGVIDLDNGSTVPTIISQGVAGDVNIISAPVVLGDTSTGNVTLSGTVPLSFTGSITNSGASHTLADTITSNGAAGLSTISGPIFLSETGSTVARTLTITTSSSLVDLNLSGVISDGGAAGSSIATKTSNGIITISGNNTFSGTATLGGTVAVDNNNAFGTARIVDNSTTPTLIISDAPHTLANNILLTTSGSQGMIITGTQNLTLNGYLGFGNSRTLANNGTGTVTINGNIWAADGKSATFDGTGNFIINGPITNNLTVVNGTIPGVAGLNKSATTAGTGTMVLNNANSFSGNTGIATGAIQLGNAGALSYSANVTSITNGTAGTAGILDLNGQTLLIGKDIVMGTGTVGTNAGLTNTSSTPVSLEPGSSYSIAGSGLTSVPTITVSGGTSATNGTATVNSLIVGAVTSSNGGSGFTSVPTISLTGGGGSNATATAALKVGTIAVTAGGTGYTSAPTVATSSGGGTAITATVSMDLLDIAVTSGGTGYDVNPPTVMISGGGGTGATATANVNGAGMITSFTITSMGTGYTSAPTVAISGGNNDAVATVDSMELDGVTLTGQGNNYTSVPTITFTGGGGTGASGTASLAISGYALSNFGTGYTAVPTVNINGGGGTGASATSTLNLSESLLSITTGSGYTSAPTVAFSGTADGSTNQTVTSDYGHITLNSGTTNNMGGIGDITVDEIVTGGGNLYKVGGDTVNLTNVLNTNNGTVTAGGGLLQYSNAASEGSIANNSITAAEGGAVGILTGSTNPAFLAQLNTASVGGLALASSDAAVDLDFISGTLATLNGMSVGAVAAGVVYTGTITPANSTYRLGGGGKLTLSNTNALNDTAGGAGPNSLAVVNGGTVLLASTNSYSGTTTVQGTYIPNYLTINNIVTPTVSYVNPILSVAQLADGASSIGNSAVGNAANLVLNGGTFQYSGTSNVTTNRLFTIGPTGATLDSSGAGTVNFTNAGAEAVTDFTGSLSVATLVTTTAVITITGDISNILPGWTVTDAAGDLASSTTLKSINSLTSLTLSKNPATASTGPDTLTFGSQARTLTLTGSNTGQNTLSSVLTDSPTGQLSIAKTGTGTWLLRGTNTFTGAVALNGGDLNFSTLSNLGAGTAINFAGGTLQYASGLGSPPDVSTRTVTLGIGGGTIDTNGNNVTFANSIGNSGVGGLGKAGAGTLTLNAANTYLGSTTVSGGTLQPAVAGALNFGIPVAVNAALGNGTTVNSGGTLDLDGQALTEPIFLNGGTLGNSSATAASVTTGVKAVVATAAGSGISGNASINVTGGGAGDVTTPLLGLTSALFTISNVGSGFTSGPTVTLSGGGGTGATMTATQSGGGVVNLTVTNPGSGYTSAPMLTFSGGGGGTGVIIASNNSNFILVGTQESVAGSGYSSTSTASLTSATGSGGVTFSTPQVSGVTLQSSSSIGGTGNISLSGPITGTGNLSKIGTDALTLSAANTYNGNTTVSLGTLNVTATGTLPSTTNLTVDGTANFAASTGAGIFGRTLASLTVASGGKTTIAAPSAHANRTLLTVGGLSVSGVLDLSGNDMIVHNGSQSAITAAVKAGYNGGSWNGSSGILSSAAAATSNTAIGIELNSNGGGGTLLGTFDGQPVTSTDVLVKYTYFGDANLDGVVNGSDYTLIDNGFNNSLTGWHNGDFNYDGVVNGDDYTLIDNAFNTQGTSLAAGPAEMVASNTAQIAGGSASAVPEPASIGLLGVAAIGFLRRRRRNHRTD